MAIPLNRMIDWTLLASKPDDVDRVNPTYDVDANEQKCQLYGVFKTFFVKTDEPTDVEAIIEFQSTVTKPNSILKFGSAGEFRIYSNGTDLFMKGTNTAGKLRFYANSTEMLKLDPVANSIATYGNAINYDGVTGKGMIFSITTNRAKFTERLTCEDLFVAQDGIKSLKNISYTGNIGTGFEFDVSDNATAKQNFTVEGTANVGVLNASGQINANKLGEYSIQADGKCEFKGNVRMRNYVNYTGNDSTGFSFSSGDSINFHSFAQFQGSPTSIVANGKIDTFGGYELGGSANYFAAGGTPGGTATFNPSTATSVQFKNGLYITHS